MSLLPKKTFAAFAFAGLSTHPVMAGEDPIRLTWRAPAACPSESEFRAEITALARTPAAHEQRSTLTVSVVVTERPNGTWQARVSTLSDGHTGERIVSDTRCEDVSRAVALILALTLNPVDAINDSRLDPQPSRLDVTRDSLHLSLGFDLVASTGTVPQLGLAAQSRLALELEPSSLELRVVGFLPESEGASAAGPERIQILAAELGIAGCHSGKLAPRFGVQGCGGAEVDWLRAASSGVTEPGSATGIWPTFFLEAVARLALSERTGLRLAAQAGRAFALPRFVVTGDGIFFRPSLYTFRLGLGAELHF